MTAPPTWGLCATILAPADEILRFAAYHLEAGAHRLYLYLDTPDPVAQRALKAHPKVRVISCDSDWWARDGGQRPVKHQARQTLNATHAYNRRAEVDWLIHMDVDEFLVANGLVAEHLAALPPDIPATRIRPMEALAGDGTAFKDFVPAGPDRARVVADLYPRYGAQLKGGFLSHLAGKVFVRTGMDEVRVQIHNAFRGDTQIAALDPQPGIRLAHCHARSWEQWIAAYRYRLTKGSYRTELAPNRPRDKGGISVHDLFRQIEKADGEAGLRAFFEEVCADTPRLRARLAKHGLLRECTLRLDEARASHFPEENA